MCGGGPPGALNRPPFRLPTQILELPSGAEIIASLGVYRRLKDNPKQGEQLNQHGVLPVTFQRFPKYEPPSGLRGHRQPPNIGQFSTNRSWMPCKKNDIL